MLALTLLITGLALSQTPTTASEDPRAFWEGVREMERPQSRGFLDSAWQDATDAIGPTNGLDDDNPDDIIEVAPAPPSMADDPTARVIPEVPDDPYTFDEIVVWAERERRLERQLDQSIRVMGYLEGQTIPSGTIYRPIETWRPSVVVSNGGELSTQRGKLEFGFVHAAERNKFLICPLLLPIYCFKTDALVTRKKLYLTASKEVIEELRPVMLALNEAKHQRIHEARMLALPGSLQEIWDGPGTAEQRRRRVADIGFTTANTPEGRDVRLGVDTFLESVSNE